MREPGHETPADPEWFSSIEPAATIRSSEQEPWDAEADVVIVGCGGAGVSAALQAAEEGAAVIAIDRFGGGGSTAINGGIFYAGGGTAAQREAGVQDSAEEMYKYLRMETQGVVKDATLRRFCEGSVDDADWMERHGVRFASRVYPGKTSYPDTTYYLYHSDSSLCGPYRDHAKPAPRGHRAFMPATKSAEGYGAGLYFPLEAAAEQAGVRMMRHTEVLRLVVDGSGAVVGLEAASLPADAAEAPEHARLQKRGQFWLRLLPPSYPGSGLTRARGERFFERARQLELRARKRIRIRARGGVVLSTGGYIYNREMIAHYAPGFCEGMPNGNAGDTGAGMRLGQTAGGAVDLLHHLSAWRFLNPPEAWSQGMLVNRRGERFVNETYYGSAIGGALVEDHGGKAWLILDRDLVRRARKQVMQPGVLPFQRYPALLAMAFGRVKAKTLAGLAAKMGFDPAVFAATVRHYNAAAHGDESDPFGKAGDELHAMERGPFYAVDMSIDAKYEPLSVMTLGGLKVDEETGGVLHRDGNVIPGLYAAGRTAVGICSNLYVSGLSVADCIFSGRRAGRSAAARPRAPSPGMTAASSC
jgi:3-oxo-5alpha-steroid 4-dehydrogenase